MKTWSQKWSVRCGSGNTKSSKGKEADKNRNFKESVRMIDYIQKCFTVQLVSHESAVFLKACTVKIFVLVKVTASEA